jgi:hypothetical protein
LRFINSAILVTAAFPCLNQLSKSAWHAFPVGRALRSRRPCRRIAARLFLARREHASTAVAGMCICDLDGTQLENPLRALRRDTSAIGGGATNVCCDSTARDGVMRDFKGVFLSDCNASFTHEEQEAPLKNFAKHFGVVMDSSTFKHRLLS